ncbi:MAG: hypothetical protein JJT75_02300 [Opitutales bacterium]|nr:hypothetical protein [Opitutales bacterium]MCH8541129.1 hypothetical protein [Opitutales bacterium]
MKRLILIGLFLFGMLMGGCQAHDPDEASVPWSRPASWQDEAPVMGF